MRDDTKRWKNEVVFYDDVVHIYFINPTNKFLATENFFQLKKFILQSAVIYNLLNLKMFINLFTHNWVIKNKIKANFLY